MPADQQSLSASLEDYIEVIFHLIRDNDAARSKDIAARLDVSRASVTEALRALSRRGLVNYAPYERVTLTGPGERAAEDVIRRHEALKTFFIDVLRLPSDLSEEGACRIEHAAPPEIIHRLTQLVRFLEEDPGSKGLAASFAAFCDREQGGEDPAG